VLVVVEDLVERERFKLRARFEVKKLTEGESAEIIELQNVLYGGVVGLESHDARTCKDDLQLGVEVVASSELLAPVGLFEDLVEEEHPPALSDKLTRKVGNAVALEVEVVHVDIQAFTVILTELLLGVLEQEGRLSYASRTLDAYQPVIPVDVVHQPTAHRCVRMLDEIGMRPKE
jgi:hypothetical protein